MNQPLVLGFQGKDYVTIKLLPTHLPLVYYELYFDETFIGSYPPISYFSIPASLFGNRYKSLSIISVFPSGIKVTTSLLYDHNRQWDSVRRNFQAGDILVASDNTNGLPAGYLGHSTLVIDENTIIEAVLSQPQVRLYPLQRFLAEHPRHVQYRPKNPYLGKKAKGYAYNYLLKYTENKKNGLDNPNFSILSSASLDDEWGSIYCSKLVWLSYYYGAGLEIDHDFFIFAPLNLSSSLEQDPRFQLIYKHPEFKFFIEITE